MKQTVKCLKWKWYVVALFVTTLASQNPCMAGESQACSDNLDQLRRASATAADTRAKVVSAQNEFETIKGQMQECIRSPEQFDPHQDQCGTLLKEWGDAKSVYDQAKQAMENNLDEIARYSQNVQQTCQDIKEGATAAAPVDRQTIEGSKEAMPDVVKEPNGQQAATITPEEKKAYNSTELEFCMRAMSERECRRRLNLE